MRRLAFYFSLGLLLGLAWMSTSAQIAVTSSGGTATSISSAAFPITAPNGGAIRTGTTAADTLTLSAYDVDGTAYTPLLTLTAGNTPSMTGVFAAGTLTNPSIAFADSTNSGFYRTGGYTYHVVSGVKRLLLANGVASASTGQLGFSSTDEATLTIDATITREAAATLQLGADLNGTTVAYTLKSGDGITGTDIAGANLTLAAGRGTGAGAPGTLIFQTATEGSSGTTAQTLATRLTLDALGGAAFGAIATQDVIKILPVTSGTRFTGTITNTGDYTADRTHQLPDYNGIFWATGERFQRPHVIVAADWTAIDLGDNDENYVLGGSMGVITYFEEGAKTVRSWVENATGLNLDADTTNNEGVEILLADGIGATLGDGWFTTGSNGGCFEVSIQIGNVSTTDQVLIGFRQTEAFDAAINYENYTNWAVIGLRSTDGAIVATGERAGGGTLTNDATGVTWADGETKTLRYCISTARAVTASVNGAAVTLTNSGAAMTTAINMAPFVSYMHGAEAADPDIYITRWAFWRQ